MSINKKIPAIFIDRDGVINKDMGPQKYSNPLNFLKDSVKGLQLLRKTKYLIFLITNQSAIAKGFVSYKEVENSFKNMNYIYQIKIFILIRYIFAHTIQQKVFLMKIKNIKLYVIAENLNLV